MELIKINRKSGAMEDVKFLATALDKKSYKAYHRVINVKDGICHSTDGNRVHRVEDLYIIPNGQYLVEKNTKTEVLLAEAEPVSYPDIEACFRTKTESCLETHNGKSIPESTSITIAKINKVIDGNTAVNCDLLRDILSFSDVFDIYIERDIFVFFNGKRAAVIAPIKYDMN